MEFTEEDIANLLSGFKRSFNNTVHRIEDSIPVRCNFKVTHTLFGDNPHDGINRMVIEISFKYLECGSVKPWLLWAFSKDEQAEYPWEEIYYKIFEDLYMHSIFAEADFNLKNIIQGNIYLPFIGERDPDLYPFSKVKDKPKVCPGIGLPITSKEFNDRLERSGYAKGNAIDMIMRDFPREETDNHSIDAFVGMVEELKKNPVGGPPQILYPDPASFIESCGFPEKLKKFKPGNLVLIETILPGWFDDGSDMTMLTPGVIKEPGPDDEDYHLDPENCYVVEFLYLGMEMRSITVGKERIKSRE